MTPPDDPLVQARAEQIGEANVRRIIDALEPVDGPLDRAPGEYEIETNGLAPLARSRLRSMLETRRFGLSHYEVKPIDQCQQRFSRQVDLPFYDNPENLSDTLAWADVCVTPRSWLQMSVAGFVGDPIQNLLSGLSPDSVERVRDGLRDGDDVVPMGFVEVGKDGYFTGDQEGRNRGVAALLEGIEWMQGRVFINWDE